MGELDTFPTLSKWQRSIFFLMLVGFFFLNWAPAVLFSKKLSALLFHIQWAKEKVMQQKPREWQTLSCPLFCGSLSLEQEEHISARLSFTGSCSCHQGVMWAWAFERFPQVARLLSSSIFVKRDFAQLQKFWAFPTRIYSSLGEKIAINVDSRETTWR